MQAAAEYQIVRPGLFYWQVYEPSVKTELCCCALETPRGLVFCDPVPLAPEALEEMMDGRTAHEIVLTNANHERGAAALARRLGVEVWAGAGAKGAVAAGRWYGDGEALSGGVETISLEGFAAGETALWWDGVLIMGDALIHAPPYGFAVLPEKYCGDYDKGRVELRKLLGYRVEILMFAHGLPIVARARERLAGVVEGT